MKLSLEWLGEFVDIADIAPAEIARRLTMATAEVEGVTRIEVPAHFKKVTTVRIVAVDPHPDPKATKIRLATVFDGARTQQIVCGAPNIEPGQIVPFAPLGTVLPGGLTIEERNIRGFVSAGMLCSDKELGLSEEGGGIRILPPGTPVGERFVDAGIIDLADDHVIEIDNKSITHRPDLWGHYGFAREIAAVFGRALKRLATVRPPPPPGAPLIPVHITVPELCYRYACAGMTHVSIVPAPTTVRARLTAVGLRPINAVVDATNYVMAELGRPLHAFDRRTIESGRIVVRTAAEGETLTTLDDRTHRLSPDDLLISDGPLPLALAGIMGGHGSAIADDTTDIVLESAVFRAAAVRRTAQRHDLRTDSSARFEKSLDPEGTVFALNRAAALIAAWVPGARLSTGVTDVYPTPYPEVRIDVTPDRIRAALGLDHVRLSDAHIVRTLRALDFGVTDEGDRLVVQVPSFRATKDVGIEQDIVEEIGRTYGYDHIPPKLPVAPTAPPRPANPQRAFEHRVRDTLCAAGFDEVYLNSLVDARTVRAAGGDPDALLTLRNVVSGVKDRLRTSLVPGVLAALGENLKHSDTVRLFEIGRGYFPRPGAHGPVEEARLAALGAAGADGDAVFFALKGAVEALTVAVRRGVAAFEPGAPGGVYRSEGPFWHPGRAAVVRVAGTTVGVLGTVHPRAADGLDLPRLRVAVAEFDLDVLFALPEQDVRYEPVPELPGTVLDFTARVPAATPVGEVGAVVAETPLPPTVRAAPTFVSVFAGPPVPAGLKAVTWRLTLQPTARALTGDEIEGVRRDVFGRLGRAGWTPG